MSLLLPEQGRSSPVHLRHLSCPQQHAAFASELCRSTRGALWGRQVLDAARLIAPRIVAAGSCLSGFDFCAEALTAAACADLTDEVLLLKAEALLQAQEIDAAITILKVAALCLRRPFCIVTKRTPNAESMLMADRLR